MTPQPKFGCIIPYVDYADTLYLGRQIERNGFDSLWFSDHVIGVGDEPALEQWAVASVLASQTRDLEYGFATTHPYRSPPHILAQQITTTDVITNGNFICGIGAGEAMNLKPYGVEMNRPVSRLVETLELMERLWTQDAVDYDGEFYTYDEASLPIENIQSPHPPIWIGGIGPRMQKITAHRGDGWIPYLQPPDQYEDKLENILDMRDEDEMGRLDRGIYTPMGIAEDRETALEQYGPIGKQIALLSPSMLAEAGHEELILDGIDLVNFTYDEETQERMAEAMEDVPMELVEEICVIGSPEDAVERIESFVEAGVEHFALDLFGDLDSMKTTVELAGSEVVPHFRG